MRKRIWVVAVVAGVAGGLLTGASLAARAANSATEDVNLTMWWWGEQEAAGAKKWLAETGCP